MQVVTLFVLCIADVALHSNHLAQAPSIFVDCRGFKDPAHVEHLRDHIGTHPTNMHQLVFGSHNQFDGWLTDLNDRFRALKPRPEEHVIAFFCKKGRHRSVACAAIFYECIRRCSHVMLVGPPEHLSSSYWYMLCDNCPTCRDPAPQKTEAIAYATNLWKMRTDTTSSCAGG